MPTRNCKPLAARMECMWKLPGEFGQEKDPFDVFLAIIANRYALIKGAQLIRDELLLSFNNPNYQHEENWKSLCDDVSACACDLSLPSVLTTCGYTMCGDRICQSNALRRYQSMVRKPFAWLVCKTLSDNLNVAGRRTLWVNDRGGEVKPELFFATGGGTDSGPTLAHVTVGHALDPAIRQKLYTGNSDSCFLVNIDVCTHCGHLDIGADNTATFQDKAYEGVGVIYGLAQESVFRDPRPCCGAIVGMLTNFNLANPVHVRLRTDLGEANWNFLSKNDVTADDGSPVRFLIAAAIIAIQGMRNTLDALGPGGELDERGVGHMTAQVQVNNLENKETILFCARATVYNGEILEQGLGVDATKYEAIMDRASGRVKFLYDGKDTFPIQRRPYQVVTSCMPVEMKVAASPHCLPVGDENATDIKLIRRPSSQAAPPMPAPALKSLKEEEAENSGSFSMGSLSASLSKVAGWTSREQAEMN